MQLGSERYPVDGIKCTYDRDKYDQAFWEIEKFCKLHAETNLLNHLLISRILEQRILFVHLTRQKDKTSFRPTGLKVSFSAGCCVASYVGNAPVLTPTLMSISSDGRRHSDRLFMKKSFI